MRKILTGCILTALLASCSGEDDSVTYDNSLSKEVNTIYDLGKCTDSRRGEFVYVVQDEVEYFCYSGKWIREDELGKESSSSDKVSSDSDDDEYSESSTGKDSSSSAEDKSSTSKDSSSSSVDSSSDKVSSATSSSSGTSSSVNSSGSSEAGNGKVFVDPRDGKKYRMVTIGSQTWFAENVNYRGNDVTSYCHSGKPENCDKYGSLYDWDNAKKACPSGTHLPTIEELRELLHFVGEDSSAVVLMADTGWTRDDGYLGTDKYGFAMLPGSYKASSGYGSSLGWCTNMWTASDSAGLVYAVYLGWNLPYASIGAYDLADGWGMSVRCITGESKPSSSSSVKSSSSSAKSSSSSAKSSSSSAKSSSSSVKSSSSSAKSSSSSVKSSSSEKSSWQFLNPAISYGEMTDSRDGQVYKTIVIDNITWMAENLNFESANSYCYNDSSKYCATYGRMYTWSAALKACPDGWHLPSYDEAYALTGPDLSGQLKGGDKLRSMVGWNEDGRPGLDTYGFSASPGGRRISSGQYYALGTEVGYWFIVEDGDIIYDWVMEFHHDSPNSMLTRENEDWAYSVRCVKDAK
ncbi:FISUMP domain-containing protein [Fibrobacter sp. UBA4309]|uniref:FISUMP domain-containing protein n=1 Tax=Fibrobacter sp. UBA4309 TaxID=1946537 RepID=UPI0025BAE127|nr:FISUMP domain-containing protein [Fibrobacter sp. UBA4309]